MTKLKADLQVVKEKLDKASAHNLQVEVVYYALKSMKENPEISISEAMIAGACEWDV